MANSDQMQLFDTYNFPKTRYQGSKYKLRSWIGDQLSKIEFDTALDAFSGTCSISYTIKEMGKQVTCNDILPFNTIIGKALVENSGEVITNEDIVNVLTKKSNISYKYFIESTFHDIYFTDEENQWLDIVVQNILLLENEYKRAMLFWAVFQACISKRPYNLFHRKNLYVRTSEVERSFGNKATWDKSFDQHFKKFCSEINNSIFDNNRNNFSVNGDILESNLNADLIYIDPPYIPNKGTLTLYGDFYHFLDGLVDYSNWQSRIDYSTKNLKIRYPLSIWENKKLISSGFEQLIDKFKKSTLAISYRSDGHPSIETIISMLKRHDKKADVVSVDYKYVLSKIFDAKEVLIISE